MTTATTATVTELLQAWKGGNRGALAALMPIVYQELRRLAQRQLTSESAEQALQATALVHEAYLRLVDKERPQWRNRAHFFAVAALVMRRILIDQARRRRLARKEGSVRLALRGAAVWTPERSAELVALDDALTVLADVDARKARVVELRFFGGLTISEVAEVLGLSSVTVVREWRMARAWLLHEVRPAE